mmetsp:Transcript_18500/g.59152  ORF Transcript_18500/g.59152 Transcript_18500/m.59152 type:complete len:505 (+) Transcript_18500:128-1642(+)
MEEHERLPAELASQVESLFVSQPEASVSAAVETLFQVERAISTDELSGAISPQDAARARGIMHDPDALFGYVRASECRADAAAMLVLASAHGEDDGATHVPAGGAHIFEGDGDESPLHALSEVTGLAPEEAIVLLEAAGGDLSAAVSLHIENGEADAELRRRQAREADEERQASAAAKVAVAQALQAAERDEPPPPGEAAGPSPASARGASARGAAPAARARRRLPARARALEEPTHAEATEVERLRARAVLELAPLLWQLKASGAPVGSRDLAAAAAGSLVFAGRGDPRANIGFLREYLEFWLVPPAPSLAPSLRSPLEITPAHFEPFALDGPILSGAGHARPDGPGRGAPLLLLHLALLDPSASWYSREALRCAAIWSTERTVYEVERLGGSCSSSSTVAASAGATSTRQPSSSSSGSSSRRTPPPSSPSSSSTRPSPSTLRGASCAPCCRRRCSPSSSSSAREAAREGSRRGWRRSCCRRSRLRRRSAPRPSPPRSNATAG